MEREIIHGHGLHGLRIELNVCDMFAANETASELKTVIDNHTSCKEYNKTPFDKRKKLFPEGAPTRIELSEKTLQNLHKLMCTLSYEDKSTLFDEDKEEDDKNVEDDEDANKKFRVRLIEIGPNKLGVIKAVKEFTKISFKEAKILVDMAEGHDDMIVASDLSFLKAIEFKTMLEEASATAEVLS